MTKSPPTNANRRAVCLNCMDGRVQIPVLEWIQENHGMAFVDVLTEPGMDGIVAHASSDIAELVRKVRLSVDLNQAEMVFLVGHHDCRGNPVSDDRHKADVTKSVERLKTLLSPIPVIGLWVTSEWTVEAV